MVDLLDRLRATSRQSRTTLIEMALFGWDETLSVEVAVDLVAGGALRECG
jgi:hypothetical protein